MPEHWLQPYTLIGVSLIIHEFQPWKKSIHVPPELQHLCKIVSQTFAIAYWILPARCQTVDVEGQLRGGRWMGVHGLETQRGASEYLQEIRRPGAQWGPMGPSQWCLVLGACRCWENNPFPPKKALRVTLWWMWDKNTYDWEHLGGV